ncbi:MAG: dipeptide epimerase [Alphaproteobacteria bacterium]|nr:dipeptide epimerase [Alphaproteobacteria bacterium]
MTSHRPREVVTRIERFAIAGSFTISRGAKTEALTVVAEITRSGLTGRGECVPYARYGETPESVLAAIEAMRSAIEGGMDRAALRHRMGAGAARNALDCALIDLEAKQAGLRAWEVLSLAPPVACTTAYTISLADPASMAEAAGKAAHRALLKIKLGRDGDDARIAAVRQAAPRSELIVDANEAWTTTNLEANLAACAACGVTLVEQPLPAGRDAALASIRRPVAVCADESVHETASLAALAGRYDAVNIKLDKSGGLTEALSMADEAKRLGFDIMVGCMVASSLAMAPAMLLTRNARFVDLDGPLLLSRDRPHGLHYEESLVHPPQAALWG